MTNRERLIVTLKGKAADRPPFPMWLGFTPWAQTLDRWREESGLADLDVAAFFGFERFFECVPVEYGPFPHFSEREISSDAEYIISTDYRGITRRNRRDSGSMPEWIDHPVKGPSDWERYKAERLRNPFDLRLASLDEFFMHAERKDYPVQLGLFPWGVFGTLRDLLGTTGCLLAFYDHPELVHDIIDTYVDLWLRLYEAACARGRVDHIHIWEDMSGKQGSLISMQMVEEFMMPAYDRIASFAANRSIPILSVDTDGKVGELLRVLMRHGVNACMPFEAQAGNDILRCRREFPTLGMMGGLDKAALARSRDDIHRELNRAQEMLCLGGWIAGFDHLIPPDVPWRHYVYAVTELRRMILP